MIMKLNIFIVYLLFTITSALPAKNSDPLIDLNIDTIGINEEVLISNKEPQKREVTESKSELKCKEYRKLCDSSQKNHILNRLIIGGKEAVLGEFPHMVALGTLNSDNTFESVCGGTLIAEQWVLTAAHCLHMTHCLLGTIDLKNIQNGELIKIDKVERYPSYRLNYLNSDIALMKLSRKVLFNTYIRPACLHQVYDSSPKEVTATGWGVTEKEEKTNTLMKVKLDVVSNVECTQKYANHVSIREKLLYGIAPSMLCAGDKKFRTKDTCYGDSGGPIKIALNGSCLYEVVGITSFGEEFCGTGPSTNVESMKPGVYTRVSHYLDWIEETVWP